jgi:hypothetical protein
VRHIGTLFANLERIARRGIAVRPRGFADSDVVPPAEGSGSLSAVGLADFSSDGAVPVTRSVDVTGEATPAFAILVARAAA